MSLLRVLLTVGQFIILTLLYCQSTIDQDKFESLSNEIKKIVKDTKAVGVSVALIENYQVVWAKGFGTTESGTKDSVTTETLFQTASITKSITAMTVMKEVQEGVISLTEDINNQLTSWHIPPSEFIKQTPVNVKQLLSHTSGVSNKGFPAYEINEDLPTIIQALNGEKPSKNDPVTVVWYPGKLFSYSPGGYSILELLLRDTENKEIGQIVESKIFEPLQMDNSTFEYHLPNQRFKSIASGHLQENKVIDQKYFILQPLSFGGLWSTPTDLAKFLIEMQLSLKGKSNKILNQENTALMLKPVIGQYGLGFSNEKRGNGVLFFGHDGHNYGYISSMIGSFDKGFGVVIMTNSENGWKAVNKIKKIVGRKFWGF
jgi:CubicO group peptidase (beta-lactamase class C family)